ncbi:MAG: exosome complex protein Rrp42 [Candidatus Nanoarchaeia archaeon]|nr:exosome complex protein Rrp42 [Candidatus Nanoarchaeia archaeon]
MNKQYIMDLLKKGKRADNRGLEDYREITVEYGISPKNAEGSARVKIGETEVVCGVKFEVGTPFPDKPDEGTIMVNAELSPLSSPDFETGPPRIDSIELARVVDRGIRESKCLDFKKLCIKEGEKVWMVYIDLYSINNGGNLFDAASLVALAALKDAKLPKYDEKSEKIVYEEKLKTGLHLNELPVEVTVCKVGETFFVDPNFDEEDAVDARLTVAVLEDGRIAALQKGNIVALTPEEIDHMVEMAQKISSSLRLKL